MLITSEQMRAARMLLRWEQSDLARASGVSLSSVKRLERIPGPLSAHVRTVEALRAALEGAGVEFTNGDQPGVRLKRTGGVGTRFAAASFSGTGLRGVGTRFAAGEFARVVEQLRELTDRASAEVPSKEELLESVEAISPDLAEKIAPLLRRKGVLFIIAVLLWIIHVNVNVNVEIDLNQIFESAVRAIEGDE